MSRCIEPNKHISAKRWSPAGILSDYWENYRGRLESVGLATNESERSDPGGQISLRRSDTCCQIVRRNTTARSFGLYVQAP